MTLRTLLLGRLLPTIIGVASFMVLANAEVEAHPYAMRKINALLLLGILLIWSPSVPYFLDADEHPLYEAAIRGFGWLLLLSYVVAVFIVLRGARLV